MADYNDNFTIINISLTDLSQLNCVQVGYDTDGNFKDPFDPNTQAFLTLEKVCEETAYFQSDNPVDTGITQINIIKLCHRENGEITVLAYRTLNYTIDVIPSDESKISVSVTLEVTVIGQQEGHIQLNYLEHSLQTNPLTVHSNIDNLPFQKISEISIENFPNIITVHDSDSQGVANFDSSIEGLQRSYGTPDYYAGSGKTYSNLLWYYWNTTKIISFLNELSNRYNSTSLKNYISSIVDKIDKQKPMLGFNSRYGSYLYWYNITETYISVIYVGSNHYNAIDIFITHNTENILPHECVFWNEESKQFRLKINRWYNHLYFIADNIAYQINTNLLMPNSVYMEEIEEPFAYSNDVFGDVLKYNIRAFNTEIPETIQVQKLSDTIEQKYWQLEFTDLGDVLVSSFTKDEQLKIGIKNILDDSFFRTYTLNDIIDAMELAPYNDSGNYRQLFNKYMIDNQESTYRLYGLYQTTLVHLQYFLSHDYTPLYLGEEYSIGWSNMYHNYLTLFKVPTKLSRRRTSSEWLDGAIYIEQGKIGHIQGFSENIYSGEQTGISEIPLAAARGVVVMSSINKHGAYRKIR